MQLLPHFPLHYNAVALFGLTLLLGVLGGEIAKLTRFLPRISGYIIVGFVVGPNGFNIVTPSLLADARIFVDVALGLVLFNLGRHLDIRWLRHDRGLLPMALIESSLTFILVFFVLYLFNFPWLSSALAATIAIATSPAIVMMVTHDLSSTGPVTRRALILTSLNNLFALVLFTLLLPFTQLQNLTYHVIFEFGAYRLLGSVILGLIIFLITLSFAQLIGKSKETQFVLFVGAVTLGIGLATALNLSSMLTLFVLGVAARNLDYKHKLTEVDFGWLARLFFVLLFVVTGVYLQLQGLWQASIIVFAFLFVKILAKLSGVMLFSRMSRLTKKQALALGFVLCPMAELAIGMTNRLVEFNPEFSHQLIIIVTAVVAILNIFGPIVTQIGLIKSGEAAVE